ncbi:MAG TPA: AAA family ATPase, partial [Povalibacter sp.]
MSDESLNPLISALLDPSCYPHAVQKVELIQTHLSWVLLAGEYAYKIRRPVRFDFVDMTTLERRRQDCLDELRLNQRFAPHLYVDVVSIGGTVAQPMLHREPAGEYAVRLHRFPPQDELAALLAGGTISVDEMIGFGARLARIHVASPVCNRTGSAAALNVATDNANELLRLSGNSDTGQAHALAQWLAAEWARIGDIADRRCADGFVRECHGDLHAGNIVRLRGELTAFDAISFNERLRCIDVASDIAFLVMDLQVRQHRSLAYAVLNGWLEASGDYEAVRLLRFFVVHRALVRAKVALLNRDTGQSERYVALATDMARPTAPALTITCGLSGSGKTWMSTRVMTEASAIRVRSDVERKRLAGLRADESSGGAIYSVEFNTQVYEHLRMRVRCLLQAGQHVIVDAASLRRGERLAFQQLAAEEQATYTILHCTAPED